ncbi:hypothetical protein TNCV_23481 [Trichonephila clavipes]|nr:hypothetical protein TNCV_23481 [Trichonephila clavipes]
MRLNDDRARNFEPWGIDKDGTRAGTPVQIAIEFNALYGRQGCIPTRTVESNQGGRIDGNEFVADFFLSGASALKALAHHFSRLFPHYKLDSTNPPQKLMPGAPPSNSPFTQISIVLFNIVFSMP